MGNLSGENNFIAIVSIILSAIGIIVGVLLVKEGREYLSKKLTALKNKTTTLWGQYLFRSSILLIVGLSLLGLFVKLGYITFASSLPWATFLLIIFLMLNSLNTDIRNFIEKTDLELNRISSTVNRLTEIEKAELKFVKEKWGNFLEQVSSNISLTAIHNVLIMSEPFADNN